MRILNIVADGAPGGGTTHVLGISQDLAAAGIDPSRIGIVSQQGSYLMEAARQQGFWSQGVEFFRSRFDPGLGKRLKAVVEQFSPDVLQFHGARSALQLCMKMPRQRHFKIAYTVHGFHFYHKNALARALAIRAERKICSVADATVFVCEADRDVAIDRGIINSHTRHEVIYNGFLPERIATPAQPIAKTVAVLGRLTYQKDPLLSLEIARLLASEGYKFLLIGGGDMEAQVREQVRVLGLEKSVEVTGALSHRDALAALATAEMMLLPSRWEGFPIAPLEALYNGIPVVAAAVSGIPEIVLHEKTGLLVHGRTSKAYADAIRRLHQEPALHHRLAAEGREYVQRMFTRDKNVKAYLSLYEGLIGSPVTTEPTQDYRCAALPMS